MAATFIRFPGDFFDITDDGIIAGNAFKDSAEPAVIATDVFKNFLRDILDMTHLNNYLY
jgi:hypothetical protein